ncbi:hypothetical protein I4U23_022041 [Adineta vaga]|nr:hypothetical protein I4U23_022041 [Adineta vaga]
MKLLLFFLLFTITNQLSCINREKFTFSTISFNKTHFDNILKSIKPTDEKYYQCQLTLNYTANNLRILFSAKYFSDNLVISDHPKLTTTFSLNSNLSTITHLLIYGCSTNNCDLYFALEHVFFLINHNNTPLDGTCVLNTDIIKNLTPNYGGGCGSKEKTKTTVKITSIPSKHEYYGLQHQVFYTCMFNGCNNITLGYNVLYVIHKLHNVVNIIYGKKERDKQTTNMFTSSITDMKMTSSLTNSTIIYTKKSTQFNIIFSINHININNSENLVTTLPSHTVSLNSTMKFKVLFLFYWIVFYYIK